MVLNWVGVLSALAAVGGIWAGHVAVRRIEARAVSLWLPVAVALALGLGLEIAAMLARSPLLAAPLGILGMTVLWDAVEFRRQQARVARGHAPANLRNPRHARLVAGLSNRGQAL